MTHPPATGITGFISRAAGVHPLIAAGFKYVVIGSAIIGGYKVWEARIEKGLVKDITIEKQAEAIDDQQASARNRAEDTASRERHITDTIIRETQNYEDQLSRQAARLAELETRYEALKHEAANRPCLREPWPNGLQRRGGFDLNRKDQDRSGDSDRDRSLNADDGGLHGDSRDHPGGQ